MSVTVFEEAENCSSHLNNMKDVFSKNLNNLTPYDLTVCGQPGDKPTRQHQVGDSIFFLSGQYLTGDKHNSLGDIMCPARRQPISRRLREIVSIKLKI